MNMSKIPNKRDRGWVQNSFPRLNFVNSEVINLQLIVFIPYFFIVQYFWVLPVSIFGQRFKAEYSWCYTTRKSLSLLVNHKNPSGALSDTYLLNTMIFNLVFFFYLNN